MLSYEAVAEYSHTLKAHEKDSVKQDCFTAMKRLWMGSLLVWVISIPSGRKIQLQVCTSIRLVGISQIILNLIPGSVVFSPP